MHHSFGHPSLNTSMLPIPRAQIAQGRPNNTIRNFRQTMINQRSNPRPTGQVPRGWRLRHEGQSFSIKVESLVGEGTFGKVYKARILESNEVVAIKQVEIQQGYEFREVDILGSLRHRNICPMKLSFKVPRGGGKIDAFIVMDYVPCSLYDVIRRCRKSKRRMTENYIMLLTYQLLKGIAYIHSKDICHRDLKPANILLNLMTNELKICDFGSAKRLKKDEVNATYICSRFYRPPEAILSCQYTNSMDMWSVGCIIVELYRSEILFKGATSLDQMIEIIKVIGTPTEQDLKDLGKRNLPYELRISPPRRWKEVLGRGVRKEAIDLISKMLVYSPVKRITAAQSLRHTYFDPLRDLGFSAAIGNLPTLFDTEEERLNISPRMDGGDCSLPGNSMESITSDLDRVLSSA